MKIEININELRKAKLFVATPMYGGQCAGLYTKSIADLSALCAKYGLQLQLYYLFNESLITRARNYCCDEFLRSGATHLLFLDSDIGFNPHDVIAMLTLMLQNPSKYDIMGAPYPKKCISWEKILQAVNKGVADENPNELDNFVGDYVFNPKGGSQTIPLGEPAEVMELGTGFMMIQREVFKKYDDKFPELKYKPDHIRTEHFDGTREIMAYFDCIIDPKSKRYLSEDYMFCYNAEKAGIRTWLCPWMKTTHVGSYMFGGSLSHLATVGASATADPGKLKKKGAIK